MNILHLIDTTGPGGAETVFTELAARSIAGGESRAVVRGPGWVHDQLVMKGVCNDIIDCKGSFNWRFLLAVRALILRHRIDLVHSHLLGSNVYASLAGALTSRPVVTTFHGVVDISPDERFAQIKFGAIKRYSAIVSVSEELRDSLSERMGIPLKQITLIPNAIDCRQFCMAAPQPLREQLGISSSTALIGSLGNIRPAKDYPTALRALAKLRNGGVEAALLIAGHQKEPLTSELFALRDKLNLKDHVYFLGFLDAPERFIAALDLFLLSSSSEGHPLALTQAMAAGIPIVATRCGVERIISDDTAWLTNKQSPETLAETLRVALSDRRAARRRALAAQNEAFQKYDFDSMYARYHDLYGRLVAKVGAERSYHRKK